VRARGETIACNPLAASAPHTFRPMRAAHEFNKFERVRSVSIIVFYFELVASAVRSGAHAWLMRQTIQKLESLDDRTLADLGLSRNEIEPWVRHYIM
jgi:uncharacterized protein YjiS (DUF1127 family)